MCVRVDQQNRDRQANLKLEKKLQTHDWSQRVNLSIFGIIVVDTWRMYSRLTFPLDAQQDNGEKQNLFYSHLATELIDNNLDKINRTRKSLKNASIESGVDSVAICNRTGAPRCGASAHLTPTKRFRVTNEGCLTKTRFQGHRLVCKQNYASVFTLH